MRLRLLRPCAKEVAGLVLKRRRERRESAALSRREAVTGTSKWVFLVSREEGVAYEMGPGGGGGRLDA